MDLAPLADQFGEVEAVEYQPGDSYRPEGLWNGSCVIWLELNDGNTIDAVYLHIEAFETNTLAFEYFHKLVIKTPEIFSDTAVDQEFSLGSDSDWIESRVTAQETPTVQSAQRAQASAALLGDFYTIQLLVRFRPGEVNRTDCGPGASEDCTMTATTMAEFMATSGFLEDVHAGIEASIEAGA
ncbi:hypothetical protein AB0K52_23610 [Glycomyces sp. NPDC049804]|uniref:hypothetical protein n=1 Tax=Glycomyces sp. NPDC049804 TaxID=3154363 RepID=UPI00343D801C